MNTCECIEEQWGITLREAQREAIEHAEHGRDMLVVLPTGYGKSICYQGPAGIDPEAPTTIVVSPLIALMDDQVADLKRRGVSAAALHSNMPFFEQSTVEDQLRGGLLRLIYVSPERALTPAFISDLADLRGRGMLSRIVIDEAHCISMWGQDFRPSYARLGDLRKVFPNVPIMALTATATERVRREIIESLDLVDPVTVAAPTRRDNLFLSASYRDRSVIEDATNWAHDRAQNSTDKGIVYCDRRVEAETIASELRNRDISAVAYHAGLEPRERSVAQSRFFNGSEQVIVATVAFGMGVNVTDVRWVLHSRLPSSLERYHQEIGRAGRDGKPARCHVLYDIDDVDRAVALVTNESMSTTELQARVDAVSAMFGYCDNSSGACRHVMLDRYFEPDEQVDPSPLHYCFTYCDHCAADR